MADKPQEKYFPTLNNTLKLSEMQNLVEKLDPVDSAMVFSGLVLSPELQSNGFRLEALVHLLLATVNGDEKLTNKTAQKLFSMLNDTYYG